MVEEIRVTKTNTYHNIIIDLLFRLYSYFFLFITFDLNFMFCFICLFNCLSLLTLTSAILLIWQHHVLTQMNNHCLLIFKVLHLQCLQVLLIPQPNLLIPMIDLRLLTVQKLRLHQHQLTITFMYRTECRPQVPMIYASVPIRS